MDTKQGTILDESGSLPSLCRLILIHIVMLIHTIGYSMPRKPKVDVPVHWKHIFRRSSSCCHHIHAITSCHSFALNRYLRGIPQTAGLGKTGREEGFLCVRTQRFHILGETQVSVLPIRLPVDTLCLLYLRHCLQTLVARVNFTYSLVTARML